MLNGTTGRFNACKEEHKQNNGEPSPLKLDNDIEARERSQSKTEMPKLAGLKTAIEIWNKDLYTQTTDNQA